MFLNNFCSMFLIMGNLDGQYNHMLQQYLVLYQVYHKVRLFWIIRRCMALYGVVWCVGSASVCGLGPGSYGAYPGGLPLRALARALAPCSAGPPAWLPGPGPRHHWLRRTPRPRHHRGPGRRRPAGDPGRSRWKGRGRRDPATGRRRDPRVQLQYEIWEPGRRRAPGELSGCA